MAEHDAWVWVGSLRMFPDGKIGDRVLLGDTLHEVCESINPYGEPCLGVRPLLDAASQATAQALGAKLQFTKPSSQERSE